jgi:hypothetical protein
MVTISFILFSVIMLLTSSLIDVFLFHLPFLSTLKRTIEQQNDQSSFFTYLIAITGIVWAIITDYRLHKNKSK